MSDSKDRGRLIVFEGPDGVGKTTLIEGFAQFRRDQGDRVIVTEFPGRTPGTLGHHVYQLHHQPERFSIDRLEPASLQIMHVAAHIDAINRVIRPGVESGALVLLDRYWWSTWVYGMDSGADPELLSAMIRCEEFYWGDVAPSLLILVTRHDSLRAQDRGEGWHRRAALYADLARRESKRRPVLPISNDGSLADGIRSVADACASIVSGPGAAPVAFAGRMDAPRVPTR